MNLSQLNYFKKLAEVLHYTRAAQELFITQPTLSGAISSLEKELGAPLFERNGRSVLLTPYGEVFYEHVCLALRAIDDGVAAVSARSSASFGTVNLGTAFTTQDHYLPSLIRDFEEAFDKRVIVGRCPRDSPTTSPSSCIGARWMWPSAASAETTSPISRPSR